MYIRYASAFHALKTANLNVFADGENLLSEHFLNGLLAAVSLESEKRRNICGVLFDNGVGANLNKFHEGIVLRNKVGLCVYFDNNANAVVVGGNGIGNALCRDSAGLLCYLCKTLLSQKVDSLVHVAVSLSERLFAVHHAAACFFSECLYIMSCKCCHL